MKRLLFLIIALQIIFHYQVCSQSTAPYTTTQSVIPPSPDAISLGSVGFSNVNLYTGKVNYSLPIYTISQNGIDFPITLSYTGGGGIKVEEMASSVGLGWNLSSTGAVSRVIRGVGDDVNAGDYIGYMHLPDFPPLSDSNVILYEKYAKGKHDGQPDLYAVSAPGLTAQFYINKKKEVFFVEKSDLKVTPIISAYSIVAFSIQDLLGRTYYFSELEGSRSTNYNPNVEFTDYTTTTWYLTRITSEYGKDIITFTYLSGENNQIQFDSRAPQQFALGAGNFDEDATSFFMLHYKRPVLQKINFALGEVDFIPSNSLRYDLGNDRYLDAIVVKNYLGDTIRHFDFKYSYFSSNGTIQLEQGSSTYSGSSSLRLKLDSLEQKSSYGRPLTHKFVYDTSHYLPSRTTSFAMDHWGFFNGQVENQGWEPKNRIKYYFSTDSAYDENGSADREPNLTYATAGILKQVITPTGGEINFSYELNNTTDPSVPVKLLTKNFFPTLDYEPNYFNVELTNYPFSYITIFAEVSSPQYSFEYILYDSLQSMTRQTGTLVYGDARHVFKIEPGTYAIKVRRLGAHPDPDYHYFTRVLWENEPKPVNKFVGGVRIKFMELKDPMTGKTMQRNYYYNESGDTSKTTPSTGEISGVPTYSLQNVDVEGVYEISGVPGNRYYANGYFRQLSSCYPLGVTSGSFVGYHKVTVVDSHDLKTEFYFTGFKDFPEVSDGYWNQSLSNEDGLVINGKWYEIAPFAPFDERDFLRGKLVKQIMYKKENGTFSKVKQIENSYMCNMGYVNGHRITLPETMDCLTGMVFSCMVNDTSGKTTYIKTKRYNIYTTRYDLQKTIEKLYSYQGGVDSVVSETTFEYGDSPWFRDSVYHYQPTRQVVKTSNGFKITNIYYPYNWRYGIPSATSSELGHMKNLEAFNRIGIPILQTLKDSATGHFISSVKNTYESLVNSTLAPHLVKIKSGSSTAFEDRISFNRFDSLGNILEQQKTNDFKTSFIWGYKSSYPIAEVINASVSDIAYSSFEPDEKGSWILNGVSVAEPLAPTGKWVYDLSSGSISRSIDGTKSFVLSFWAKTQPTVLNATLQRTGRAINGYTYYEYKTNNNTTDSVRVSGTTFLDELRLYPVDAQMTTYSYDPLLGQSSRCDINNNITYYEYDGFGRLVHIRDKDRNILKKYCYNYQGQAEECQADTNPIWQATGETTCMAVACAQNSSYTINMQHHREVDMNPASPGYKTAERWVSDNVQGSCETQPAWQLTGAYKCETADSTNTGNKILEEKDMNPCSPTYGSTRLGSIVPGCAECPKPQNWVVDSIYCEKDAYGKTTGYKTIREKNKEACSLDPGAVRYSTEYDATTCAPTACTTTTCSGAGKKCVNGVCETGVKVYTDSVEKTDGTYRCTYHYEWSDGTWSGDYIQTKTSPCPIY